jgi:hypothetical protein
VHARSRPGGYEDDLLVRRVAVPPLAEITDPQWLAIISPVVVAAVGGAIAIWRQRRQRQRERFRPRIEAAIDGRRQAIRLEITNEGEGEGSVSDGGVVDAHRELPATFPCYRDGEFERTPLGSLEHAMVVIHAIPPTPFPEDVRLRVRWSGGMDHLVPEEPGESYYNLRPQLPWGCREEPDGSWRRAD